MTCYYLDLGGASDCMKQIFNQSECTVFSGYQQHWSQEWVCSLKTFNLSSGRQTSWKADCQGSLWPHTFVTGGVEVKERYWRFWSFFVVFSEWHSQALYWDSHSEWSPHWLCKNAPHQPSCMVSYSAGLPSPQPNSYSTNSVYLTLKESPKMWNATFRLLSLLLMDFLLYKTTLLYSFLADV